VSADAARHRLRVMVRTFGERPLDTVERHEAIRWAETMPVGVVADTVVLFNPAVDEELLERNPFRGLGRRSSGTAQSRS
jgi:hypothetical protein